jgi:serine protease AprX
MRGAKIHTILIIATIVICIIPFSGALESNESDSKIQQEILAKLDPEIIEELSDSNIAHRVDAIVACSKDSYPNHIQLAQAAVRDISITKEWMGYPIFKANLTKSQVLQLAKQQFVTRIDNNSWSFFPCMDTAREYTNVDFVRALHPEFDGDMDGSQTTYSKDDIVIAVLDTGIYPNHQDLDGGKIIGWVDLIGDWWGIKHDNPYDDCGHGTRCASIAAGSGDGNWDYRGVAPYAALVGVKMMQSKWPFPPSSTPEIVIDSLLWVTEHKEEYGIEVVSCSWGSGPYGEYNTVSLVADWVVESGLVVVVAAGNSGPSSDTIGIPGTAKYVITVGSAEDPGEGGWSLATYSSRGPCDDGRIKPDILAPGTNIMAAKRGTSNQYNEDSGTSYSAPFVSGLVALWLDDDITLLNHEPNDSNPRIKYVLCGSATDMPGDPYPEKDNDFGAGRVDMLDNWFFVANDISTTFSDAPLVVSPYGEYGEGLWPYDPAFPDYGDFYKIYCPAGFFLYVQAWGDPDLVLKIRIYNEYQTQLTESTASRNRYLGWTTQYAGYYYVRISAENKSADWYDVMITAVAS